MTAVILDLRLPSFPTTPARARHAVTGALSEFVGPAVCEKVQLLVSELVTNCIRHTGLSSDAWIEVRMQMLRSLVRVEVVDEGDGFDGSQLPEPLDGERIGGWGLVLVERLSERWGVVGGPPTKVWFEVDAGHERS